MTGATQLVLEELLMTDVQMHPFELLSWEGVFGSIFMFFTLLVLNVVPGASCVVPPRLHNPSMLMTHCVHCPCER